MQGERLRKLSFDADFCRWLRRRDNLDDSVDMLAYVRRVYVTNRESWHVPVKLMEEYDNANHHRRQP